MTLANLFSAVLNMSLAASIVILIVCLARLALRGAPKIYSYLLWALVLFRLLCPVSITSPFSLIPERIGSGDIIAEWEDDYIGDTHIYHDNRAEYDTAVEAGREPVPAGEGHYYVVTGGDGISEPETVENTVLPLLSLIWVVGMTVMILRSLVSYAAIRKQTRVSVPFRKNIYMADHIDTPFVMGIFRPRIYLPSALETAERRYIIAHERHHIRRGDHIFKALGFLALTIHWFNPLAWLAFSLASRDMEMSCDEAVIRKLGEAFRADYSETLLNLATGHRLFAGTPLAFGEGDPTGRVRNLSKWKKPAVWMIVICILVCAVLAVCLLTNPKAKELLDLPQTIADTTVITLNNDPLPNGYFEGRDEDGNIIFTDGTNTVGGVFCYIIPEGIYDPDDHIEALLYKMGIPDYMDTTLYFRGGMTAAGGGWLAEFESDVPEGEEPTVYRRHHFYPIADAVYDVWFDRILLDYETTEAIRVCVNLPDGESAEDEDWRVTLVPDRVSRTGATALFAYSGSVPGEEGAELTYDDYLSLERLVDGNWVACDELPGFRYFVGDSSYPVVDDNGMVHEWRDRFGELPDGYYRLGKRLTLTRPDGTRKSRMVYGMFTLPDAILTGPIPLENLPEKYSGEQAMIDGCFVMADGVARENKDLFHRFAENSYAGEPAFIRIVDWHYGDHSYYNAYDLSYDGSLYTISWIEDGQRRFREFPYLRRIAGGNEDENMGYDAYEHYVLVHDDQITSNIWGNLISSHENTFIDHMTVYSDCTYLPGKPQISANLAQAVLEFEGEACAVTTDFDRLEKLYLLFTDAEFLGYEPKTHSIGVGLNLILTTQDGQTRTIELDPDNDLCRIDGEYIVYGKPDEPCYIEKLWYYLDIPAWPDAVYEQCGNAFRLQGIG